MHPRGPVRLGSGRPLTDLSRRRSSWCFDLPRSEAKDVLEHVPELDQNMREIMRVLRPGSAFLSDTINRNPPSRFVTITVAEDSVRLFPLRHPRSGQVLHPLRTFEGECMTLFSFGFVALLYIFYPRSCP